MDNRNVKLKVGDRIRLQMQYGEMRDLNVEEFRQCLGVFLSDQAREAGNFTPLCELYEKGPDSESKYISNYGLYWSKEVPIWMNIPKEN